MEKIIEKNYYDNLKVWLIYDKGKSLAYVWDSNKLSETEARRKANLELFVMLGESCINRKN